MVQKKGALRRESNPIHPLAQPLGAGHDHFGLYNGANVLTIYQIIRQLVDNPFHSVPFMPHVSLTLIQAGTFFCQFLDRMSGVKSRPRSEDVMVQEQ